MDRPTLVWGYIKVFSTNIIGVAIYSQVCPFSPDIDWSSSNPLTSPRDNFDRGSGIRKRNVLCQRTEQLIGKDMGRTGSITLFNINEPMQAMTPNSTLLLL